MTETERGIRELKLAGLFDEDSDYGGMIGEAVKELLEVFGKQGHSGFSAQRVASIFHELVKGHTLILIKKDDENWFEHDGGYSQNTRCSALFKDKKGSYYLDAIVWQGQRPHDTFTGEVDGIRSRQYVKFPFRPKTFYIDVIGKEVKKGEWEYHIKDKKQLEKVFDYYEKKN